MSNVLVGERLGPKVKYEGRWADFLETRLEGHIIIFFFWGKFLHPPPPDLVTDTPLDTEGRVDIHGFQNLSYTIVEFCGYTRFVTTLLQALEMERYEQCVRGLIVVGKSAPMWQAMHSWTAIHGTTKRYTSLCRPLGLYKHFRSVITWIIIIIIIII